MSDFNITISENPINVVAQTTPIEVVVSQVGIQGIQGPSGANGGGGSSNFIRSGENLFDSNSGVSINYNTRQLIDSVGSQSLDWGSRILKDGFQNYSILYDNRILRNAAQVDVLDYNNLFLSGNWLKNGNYILTSQDSGNILNLINSIAVGTGNFYLKSNPNFYSTSGNVENTGTSLQNQINNLSRVSNPVTGSGIINYIPKFLSNGSGLINSNIIDSGNSVTFNTPIRITQISGEGFWKSNDGFNALQVGPFGALYSNTTLRVAGVFYIGSLDDVQIGRYATSSMFLGSNNNVNIGGFSNNTFTQNINLRGNNINASGDLYVSGSILSSGFPVLTQRNIIDSGNQIQFNITNTNLSSGILVINPTGLFLSIDNIYDIGQTSTNRPRNVNIGGNVRAAAGNVYANIGNFPTIRLGGEGVADTQISRSAANTYKLDSTSAILQFGGTTTGFPSIKRSGQNLALRLADDSDYTSLELKNISGYGNLSITGDVNGNRGLFGTINFGNGSLTQSRLTLSNQVGVSEARITYGANGVLVLDSALGSSFNRLQFGGGATPWPSIAKSGTNLQFRYHDDTDYCSISAKSGIFTSSVGVNLPINTSPISNLDVSGHIKALDITGQKFFGPTWAINGRNLNFVNIGLAFINAGGDALKIGGGADSTINPTLTLEANSNNSYFTKSNLGINNTSPISALDVTGNIIASGIKLSNATGLCIVKFDNNLNLVPSNIIDSGNSIIFGITNISSNTGIIRITSGGNVGIRCENPQAKFVVSGIAGEIRYGSDSNSNQLNFYDNNGGLQTRLVGNNNTNTPGIYDYNARFTINNQVGGQGLTVLNVGSGPGRVGVNNINPASALDVSGNITASGIKGNGNLAIGSSNLINNIILSGSDINFYGNTSGSAPATTSFLLPVNENIYGKTDAFLGSPDGWLQILVSGRVAKVPYYY